MITVSLFTAILIPSTGMNSVYIANVINGVVSVLIAITYSTGGERIMRALPRKRWS